MDFCPCKLDAYFLIAHGDLIVDVCMRVVIEWYPYLLQPGHNIAAIRVAQTRTCAAVSVSRTFPGEAQE